MRKWIFVLLVISACRKSGSDNSSSQVTHVTDNTNQTSFYLLNEGNMGLNQTSLDYFNGGKGDYHLNIYGEINPTIVKELGDVGNDMKIYGNKLYAVITGSDRVEVMDKHTAKHLGEISVRSGRYLSFYNGKAYISSFAAASGSTDGSGFVAEADTSTFQVLRTVTVGRQPEEMAIAGSKMYVANSGGYTTSNYDHTLSVIDLNTFTVSKTIDVAVNLHHVKADGYGNIYVSSRGNYTNRPSKLYIVNTNTDAVTDSLNLGVSNLAIQGDSAYIMSVEWSNNTGSNTISYGIVNVKTKSIVSNGFIQNQAITTPYGIAVDPVTRDILITDVKDYLLPGTLYCFDKTGAKKWSVTTGNIPSQITFIQ
ncbi:YncE family protein [Chitinophaga sancti]|uniref:YncE family protein n=1 Tax=Chitinophaga sancti TaxID=1004 RepID=UPI003F78B59F